MTYDDIDKLLELVVHEFGTIRRALVRSVHYSLILLNKLII